MTSQKPRIGEIIVVEGLHDAQRVREAVEGDVWVIGGDRIATRFLTSLQRAERNRGVVVLTDPDGPGERIRRRVQEAVPTAKHAFLRKADATGAGRVGVEFASPESVRKALLAARTKVVATSGPAPLKPYSTVDLLEAGLLGSPSAGELRRRVGDILGIGWGNAKTFLEKLNGLAVSREEWSVALDRVGLKCENQGNEPPHV